jgi:hypothetical protein
MQDRPAAVPPRYTFEAYDVLQIRNGNPNVNDGWQDYATIRTEDDAARSVMIVDGGPDMYRIQRPSFGFGTVYAGPAKAPAAVPPQPKSAPAKPARKPRKPDLRTRTGRWMAAATDLRAAFDALSAAAEQFNAALGDVTAIQEEFQEWLDAMPEGGSEATRDKLDAITGIDLTDFDVSDAESIVDEVEGADLPLGFGRD